MVDVAAEGELEVDDLALELHGLVELEGGGGVHGALCACAGECKGCSTGSWDGCGG